MPSRWVLVVDDEAAAREALCDALGSAGWKAIGAEDGAQARQRLESDLALPCVIVLDLMMPGMNGWEFRAWQRLQPRFAAVPVVLLSAMRDVAEEARRLQTDFLYKPVELASVLERIERYCGLCRQR